MIRFLTISAILSLFSIHLTAQITAEEMPSLLRENKIASNIDQWQITSQHKNAQTGLTYVYINEVIDGIPVIENQATLVLDENKNLVYHSGNVTTSFKSILRTSTNQPGINEFGALDKLRDYAGMQSVDLSKTNDIKFAGGKANLDQVGLDGYMQLVYILLEDKLTLAWEVQFADKFGAWESIYIDADNGEIVKKINHTYRCGNGLERSTTFDHQSHHKHNAKSEISLGNDGGTYRVFELPVESPLFGSRSLANNPADITYSPNGWHDSDGMPGADHQILIGNNTEVWLDRSGNLIGEGETNGGPGLNFDFPYDPNGNPRANKDAAGTNLFYIVNRTHDILAHFGFDEAAGNFQHINYSGEGNAGDRVESFYQFGANNPGQSNPATINNANFSSPVDGFNGVLRMYVWDRSERKLLNVTAPSEIAGLYETAIALFGPQVTDAAISAPVVIADDGVGVVTDGCQSIQNDVSGKIAIIDRGDCSFGEKVWNAQQAGAIAVIIADNRPGNILNMTDPTFGPLINIPAIRITLAGASAIKANINNGLMLEIVRPDLPGPDTLDSAFDNGLVIHELAHGLSNRLTGGANRNSCLNNVNYGAASEGEQMGEGWSDYFGIALTQSSENIQRRPFAAYLNKEDENGNGIRPYPYDPDIEANPVTYHDIYDASVPHGVGHVWASMLWDLHNALVDEYGFDADLINGNGGNKVAIQLVVDGLKMQPCDPGFVDGRDAILMADSLRYDGANQCLIWQVFARRGLGINASQGLARYRRDGAESYDVPFTCTGEIELSKESEELIDRGDIYPIRLYVNNGTGQQLTGIEIRDEVPENNTVREELLPSNASLIGNEVVFQIETMEVGESIILSYILEAANDLASTFILSDDLETNAEQRYSTQSVQGNNAFQLTTGNSVSGTHAWQIDGIDETCMQSLEMNEALEVPSEGLPVLTFWHDFDTESGADGGLVEISTNDGQDWIDVQQYQFRSAYNNRISVSTFQQTYQDAYTGDSDGWKQAYLDLSDFKGQSINLRYRFGCDFQMASDGWTIDDIEFIDALQYISQATLTSDQGFSATAINERYGTLVRPEELMSNQEIVDDSQMRLFPNPTSDVLEIVVEEISGSAQLRILDAQGRILSFYSDATFSNGRFRMNTTEFTSGMYYIEVEYRSHVYRSSFIRM